jgi:hypothetical protein
MTPRLLHDHGQRPGKELTPAGVAPVSGSFEVSGAGKPGQGGLVAALVRPMILDVPDGKSPWAKPHLASPHRLEA